MGNFIGTICKGAKDYMDDDFNPEMVDIITKMNKYVEAEREKKDKKLKKIENKLNKKTLRKIFN
tara:strand:+ start:528 stop:719 length:192 start_codon:yes stop_codon:yes gene_type:complete